MTRAPQGIVFRVWDGLTRPAASITPAADRRRARLLSAILVILAPASLFLGAMWPAGGGARARILIVLTGLALVIAYGMSRTRHVRWAAGLTVGVLAAAIFAQAYPNSGPGDLDLLVYLAIPITIGSLFFSGRAVFLVAAACVAVMYAYPLVFDHVPVRDVWPGFVSAASIVTLLALRHMAALQREHQAEILENKARYQRLVELSPLSIAVHQNGVIDYVNPATLELLGAARPEEVVGRRVLDFVHPDYHALVMSRIQQTEGGVHGEPVEEKFIRLDGQVIDVEVITIPFVVKGQPASQVIVWDISERKKTRAALRESEQRYAALFKNNHHSVMLLIDPDTSQIVDASPAACAFYGYTLDELTAMSITQINTLSPEEIRREMQRARQHERHHFDFRHRLKSGEVRDVEVYSGPIAIHGEQLLLSTVYDVTERKQAIDALERSEAQNRALLKAIPDLMFRIARDGRFVGHKDSSMGLLVPPEQFMGRSIYEIMPQVAPQAMEVIHRALDTGQIQTFDYWLPFEDEPRNYEARVVANGPDEALVIVRDMTEQTRSQAALRATLARTEALYRASYSLIGSGDQPSLLQAVVDNVIEALECDRASLFVLDMETRQMIDFVYRTSTGTWRMVDVSFDELMEGLTGWVLRELKPALSPKGIPDPRESPRVQRRRLATEAGSVVVAPLHYGDRLLGTMTAINRPEDRDFTPDDVELLVALANQSAAAIQNAQLFEREREQRALAEALRDTAAALNRTLNLEEVLDQILINIERVVPHTAANIMLLEGDHVRVVRARGYEIYGTTDWITALHIPITQRPKLLQLVQQREGYVVTDTRRDPDWIATPESGWVRSHICAAIRIEESVIGVLNLDSQRVGAFTQADAERLKAFADQAAIAIDNARLYAEVRGYTDELEHRVTERTIDLSVRNAVAETLSSSLDMHEMLNGVLQAVIDQLGVRGGAIYLHDPDSSALELVALVGVPAQALQDITGIVPGQVHHAIATIVRQGAGAAVDGVQQTGLPAALNVPIWRQQQIQGMITLVHDQPRPWDSDERRMLDAIGRQIGVALANAQLYAEAVRDEARTRTILQSVADALLVFDAEANPIVINPAAEALLAFYPADRGGANQAARYLWEWFQSQSAAPDQPESITFELPVDSLVDGGAQALAEQCRRQACPWSGQHDPAWPCWLQPYGTPEDHIRQCPVYQRMTRRAIQSHSAEVRDDQGQVWGMVIALHDVTTYRELDELKERFVSTVSHELRTPLAGILLQVSALVKYYDRLGDAARRTRLGQIQRQATALRELIEDILELSRFDARRSTPQKEWFDPGRLCQEIIDTMRPVIDEKSLTLNLDLSGGEYHLLADPQQIQRALRNLFANAIKYTLAGGHVTVRLSQTDSEVRIAVEDDGIGIAPEEQLYVFDRFFRAESAISMASGTGLGLAITKEIVDLHGGTIDLRSEPGKGSTFTVRLPQTIPAPDQPEE